MRALWILLIFISCPAAAQQVAITFDDAPTGDSPHMTGEERSLSILEHLASRRVPAVCVFRC